MNPYNTKRLPWKKTHHSIFSLDASEEIQMMQEDDPDRMRRNKFSLLCRKLQKMVPNVLAMIHRVELIDETISHIKELEETIRELEAEKRAREGHNRPSVLEYTKERSCMIVWAFGDKAAFFGSQSGGSAGLANQIFQTMETQESCQVLAAAAATSGQTLTVTAKVAVYNGRTIERLIDALLVQLP